MADATGMRRTRGGLSGLLLILLGAWGALVPFVGPYFRFAYTPDRAWAYTSGRLWLEVVPGTVTVLGGLIVLVTRSRLWGGIGALLAALAGGWFVVGAAVTAQFVKSGSISPGRPAGAAASSLRQFLEGVGFFTGTGVLIVFFAALALGRFSVAGGPGEQDSFPAEQDQYPTMTGQYPPGSGQPSPAGQVPPRQDAFDQRQEPTSTARFPPSPASGQAPSSSPEAGQREEF